MSIRALAIEHRTGARRLPSGGKWNDAARNITLPESRGTRRNRKNRAGSRGTERPDFTYYRDARRLRSPAESFDDLQHQRIDVLSANVVAVADIAVSVDTDTLGITSEVPVVRTEVWVRRDGGWKILHALESISLESM